MISALKMTKFNVASINTCTEAEGPYKRLCIWFQGCNIRCPGCCNPDYQAFEARHIMSLEDLIEVIKEAKTQFGIEGVTYSGGEPTCQQNLPLLTKEIKSLGLGVISFTGKMYKDDSAILDGCDVVLDGSFKEDLPETNRRLLGSKNQRIICLTERYKDCIDNWFDDHNKVVEVSVGSKIIANGDKF